VLDRQVLTNVRALWQTDAGHRIARCVFVGQILPCRGRLTAVCPPNTPLQLRFRGACGDLVGVCPPNEHLEFHGRPGDFVPGAWSWSSTRMHILRRMLAGLGRCPRAPTRRGTRRPALPAWAVGGAQAKASPLETSEEPPSSSAHHGHRFAGGARPRVPALG
jgi:hypothetical protein